MAEGLELGSEETQTAQEDETNETTTSNDSTACGSYGNSLDLGYLSNEGSLQNDSVLDLTGSQANGFHQIAPDNEPCDMETFGIEGYEYETILFQFGKFARN